jgi:hypothetical protein
MMVDSLETSSYQIGQFRRCVRNFGCPVTPFGRILLATDLSSISITSKAQGAIVNGTALNRFESCCYYPDRSPERPEMTEPVRNFDPERLHPIFREKARELLDRLTAEGIPFRLFEGFRSPERQQYLYAQGRTRPGPIVTHARPWTSYHQYGLAGDFVLFENGAGSGTRAASGIATGRGFRRPASSSASSRCVSSCRICSSPGCEFRSWLRGGFQTLHSSKRQRGDGFTL